MKKFILDNSLLESFPDTEIQYFTVNGIDNHINDSYEDYFKNLLSHAKDEAQQYLTNGIFRDNAVIASWRNVYKKFKKKKGARSSIEAMLKRVSQNREFQPIMPLVDLYNSVSLRYGIPCGGEDLDKIDGDMHLGITSGDDEFYPLGSDFNEPTLPGEVCYYDKSGAVCRCWNWRESQRTMLTENTKHAILVAEAATKSQSQNLTDAMQTLRQLIKDFFHVQPNATVTLNKDNPIGNME